MDNVCGDSKVPLWHFKLSFNRIGLSYIAHLYQTSTSLTNTIPQDLLCLSLRRVHTGVLSVLLARFTDQVQGVCDIHYRQASSLKEDCLQGTVWLSADQL